MEIKEQLGRYTESQRLVLRLSTVTYNYDTVVLVCFEEKYQYL